MFCVLVVALQPEDEFEFARFVEGVWCFIHKKTLVHDHIFSWSFITSAGSDHVNNVLQLDACQESDSRPPFGRQTCFYHDPCLWQGFGSKPIKLHLTLNYPL